MRKGEREREKKTEKNFNLNLFLFSNFFKMFTWYALKQIHHKYHKFFYSVFFKRTNMRFGRKRKVDGREGEVEATPSGAVGLPPWLDEY